METRRGFLKKTLGGAALLAAAGAVPIALRKTRLAEPGPRAPLRFFTEAEYAIFAALADRVLATAPADPTRPEFPGGAPAIIPAVEVQVRANPAAPTPAQLDVAGRADAFLAPLDAASAKDLKQLLALFDNALFSVLTGGPATPFTQQEPAQQDRHLASWAHSRLAVRRTGFQALKRLACAMFYAHPATYASVGYPGPPVELVRSVLGARNQDSGPGPSSASTPEPARSDSAAPAPAPSTPLREPASHGGPAHELRR